MKDIVFTAAAARDWAKINGQIRERLKAKLDRYAEDRSGNVKALTGRPDARLRAGDWRVTFIETEKTILVTAAGHRSKIYGS